MKKKLLLLFSFIIYTSSLLAQGTETFTNIPASSGSYLARTWTGDNTLTWNATDARTDQTLTGKAIGFRNGGVTCNAIPNGIASISFKYKQIFTGLNATIEVLINSNVVGTITGLTIDVVQTANLNNINVTGNFNLEIRQITSGLRVAIDDISWTGYNGLPCSSPTAQPTSLSFNTITNSSLVGSFVAASPAANEYLIIRSTSSSLTQLPVDGNTYSTDDVIGNGIIEDIVNINAFTSTSLNAGTIYYYFIFSVNNACIGGPLYLTASPLTGNATTTAPLACAAPTGVASSLVFTAASSSINGSFTAATGADGYLVVRSLSSSLGATPTNLTAYTVGNTFGSGTIIKFGSGTTFSASGLTASTQYYFYVFALSSFSCTGGPLYNLTSTNGNITTTASGGGEPSGYYSTTTGLNCANLKTALKTIITTGNTLNSYGDLWGQYLVSDIKPREVGSGSANVIWDIYSDNPTGLDPYNFTPSTNQCGNYSSEGDCYNREHTFPQNWFTTGTANGPGTDYHQVFPTDGKVNGVRSNFIYGEVASATSTSLNGSKLGSSAVAGITGTVFEPINAYKGDLARSFLYMVTRYQDNMTTWGNLSGSNGLQALDPSSYPSVDLPFLKLMIKWHNQDPVSQKEIDRNNAGFAFQGNRNPFVDRPDFVNDVWNSTCPGLAALPVNVLFFTGKLQNNKVLLNWQTENEINFNKFEIERSFNGTSFTLQATVKATGLRNYNFTDNADNISGRRVYYRLKKIDHDGSFTYSEVFSIHIPLNIKFSLYPNPASNVVYVQLNSTYTEKLQVQITDITGKILFNNFYIPNNGVVILPTQTLKNGTYLVKLFVNNESYLQKVVITK